MRSRRGKSTVAGLLCILALSGFGLIVVGCITVEVQDTGSAQVVADSPDPHSAPKVVHRAANPPSPEIVTTTSIDMQQRAAAIQERAETRAFFGAPPVIPHEVASFDLAANCLTCHGDGPDAEEDAAKVPHAHLASCTQCHVVQELDLFSGLDGTGNEFKGLAEPIVGQRAFAGAPPTIPHSTLMRSQCLNCHGPTGREGLRTSHPERLSCRQCHPSTAIWNQRQTDDHDIFHPPPSGE